MKKIPVFIFLYLISQTAIAQETEAYINDSVGFSFEYPSDVTIYTEWDRGMKVPENFYIFIEIIELPLAYDRNFGLQNVYIGKIRKGLENGIIAWTPFYYKSLTDIVGLADCNAFESYTLSWYGTDSIEFESRIMFFRDNYLVSVWLSADAFHDQIIDLYKDRFFVDVHGYWEWDDRKSETFLLDMKNLIKNRDCPVFEEWMNIADQIKATLKLDSD